MAVAPYAEIILATWNIGVVSLYIVFFQLGNDLEKMETDNPKMLTVLRVSLVFHVAEVIFNLVAHYMDLKNSYDTPRHRPWRIWKRVKNIYFLAMIFLLGYCGFYGLYLCQKGQPVMIYIFIWARILIPLLPICCFLCVFLYVFLCVDFDEGGEKEDDRYHTLISNPQVQRGSEVFNIDSDYA